MTANELRNAYVTYYQERGHKLAPAASLVPENDVSVLFTSAGMQPLVPYFMGEEHPLGKKLVNVQRCVRTGDIEEVGDDFHLTVFEMLGNWSLGDYFKKKAIEMSFGFLTSVVGIPVSRLAVTVFKGNDMIKEDRQAEEVWLSLGLSPEQIFHYGEEENWWGPVGSTGPCGPDSEMFYVNDQADCSDNCGPACACGKYMELGNNVFMTYNKDEQGKLTELSQKNIDVGLGFDRLLILSNGLNNVYETDLFEPIITSLETLSGMTYDSDNQKQFRIISEHLRASVFILSDPSNIKPSNSEQGYVLRRLIRRSIRHMRQLSIGQEGLEQLVESIIAIYREAYPELIKRSDGIKGMMINEYLQFNKTLTSGMKMVDKYLMNLLEGDILSGDKAFRLFDTFGFPIDMTIEMAMEQGIKVDVAAYEKCFRDHQEKSRQGAKGKFKGGLVDHDAASVKLHTATHLLNAALKQVLGVTVNQRGSHINTDRLRFDFSFERKVTKEELQKVENLVNEVIHKNLSVIQVTMSLDKAREFGAVGVFESKYDDQVKVYDIEGFSTEICGGPHVEHTSELGHFKIVKEQSSSDGVRRIKAILQS